MFGILCDAILKWSISSQIFSLHSSAVRVRYGVSCVSSARGPSQYKDIILRPSYLQSGGCLNIKMSSYQYNYSHYKDKTVSRPSNLHNGESVYLERRSLYWDRAWYMFCPCQCRAVYNTIIYWSYNGTWLYFDCRTFKMLWECHDGTCIQLV